LQLAQKMSEGMHYVVKFLWHTTGPRRRPRIAFAYPADSWQPLLKWLAVLCHAAPVRRATLPSDQKIRFMKEMTMDERFGFAARRKRPDWDRRIFWKENGDKAAQPSWPIRLSRVLTLDQTRLGIRPSLRPTISLPGGLRRGCDGSAQSL
jgi:hypothetical protein